MKGLKRAVTLERAKQGLTVAQLVENLTISPNSYYTALRSEAVTVRAVTAIAKGLGLKTSELIAKAEELSE